MQPAVAFWIVLAVISAAGLIRWTFVAARSGAERKRIFRVSWFWVSAFLGCIFASSWAVQHDVEIPLQARVLSIAMDAAVALGIGALAGWSITRSIVTIRGKGRGGNSGKRR